MQGYLAQTGSGMERTADIDESPDTQLGQMRAALLEATDVFSKGYKDGSTVGSHIRR